VAYKITVSNHSLLVRAEGNPLSVSPPTGVDMHACKLVFTFRIQWSPQLTPQLFAELVSSSVAVDSQRLAASSCCCATFVPPRLQHVGIL
jgi:hypothetical protein